MLIYFYLLKEIKKVKKIQQQTDEIINTIQIIKSKTIDEDILIYTN